MKVWNKREKGIPANAVYVGRPTKWGNRYVIGRDGTREEVIKKYEQWLAKSGLDVTELRGKDLVCWCAPLACHADVLVKLANETSGNGKKMNGKGTTVLVCGSRDWNDRTKIRVMMERLKYEGYKTIIEGEARGADTMAREEALKLGMHVIAMPAKWKLYGKSAGMRRNQEMLNKKPDLVLAFDMGTPGTAHMIAIAKMAGVQVVRIPA